MSWRRKRSTCGSPLACSPMPSGNSHGRLATQQAAMFRPSGGHPRSIPHAVHSVLFRSRSVARQSAAEHHGFGRRWHSHPRDSPRPLGAAYGPLHGGSCARTRTGTGRSPGRWWRLRSWCGARFVVVESAVVLAEPVADSAGAVGIVERAIVRKPSDVADQAQQISRSAQPWPPGSCGGNVGSTGDLPDKSLEEPSTASIGWAAPLRGGQGTQPAYIWHTRAHEKGP
jgi:hypothetical protein